MLPHGLSQLNGWIEIYHILWFISRSDLFCDYSNDLIAGFVSRPSYGVTWRGQEAFNLPDEFLFLHSRQICLNHCPTDCPIFGVTNRVGIVCE